MKNSLAGCDLSAGAGDGALAERLPVPMCLGPHAACTSCLEKGPAALGASPASPSRGEAPKRLMVPVGRGGPVQCPSSPQSLGHGQAAQDA